MSSKHPSHFHFVDHDFHDPRPEHSAIPFSEIEDLDDPQYSWVYYGHDKYGRYALCSHTGVRRGLSFGEFYGTGVVD